LREEKTNSILDESEVVREPTVKIPLSRIVEACMTNDKSKPFFYEYKQASGSVSSL
jgi:hypothetical protein